MLCGSLDGSGVWREWLSPFAIHLKLLQHCFPPSPQTTTLTKSWGVGGGVRILLHSFFEFYLYLFFNTKKQKNKKKIKMNHNAKKKKKR